MSRHRWVTLKDGHYCVQNPQIPTFTYDIPIDLCAGRDETLRWIRQLTQKQWVTREVIADFVMLVLQSKVVG